MLAVIWCRMFCFSFCYENLNIKTQIYNLPCCLHGCETWSLLLREERRPRVLQNKIEQNRIEQNRTEQNRIEQNRTEQNRIEQNRIEQNRIEQNRIEQNRLEQNRTEQNRIEQNRIEQNRIEYSILVRVLPGPMHLGLNTGHLCPIFCTRLQEPCSFSKVSDGPHTYYPYAECMPVRMQHLGVQHAKCTCRITLILLSVDCLSGCTVSFHIIS